MITTQRLTGLFSGMDTDALVRAMTMNQQNKLDMITNKRTTAEWKRDEYISLNNKLRQFTDKFISMTSNQSMMSRSSYSDFNVNASSSGSVKFSASATAKEGDYSIRVEQMAQAEGMAGTKMLDEAGNAMATKTVIGMQLQNVPGFEGYGATDSIDFAINGVEFSFKGSDTLKTVIDKVNASKAGVDMGYSQMNGSITLVSRTMGENSKIELDDYDNFFESMGFQKVQSGQNAVVYLNDETSPRILNSNSLTLDGITMTFVRPTPEAVTFEVAGNNDKSVAGIKEFIQEFNDLFADLHSAYYTRPDRKYSALTKDQISILGLSDKEVEKWEVAAKKGILNRDDKLSTLISDFRSVMGVSVGSLGSLASIGITTSRYRANEPVKLEFNEDKFLAALTENPDKVYDILAGNGDKSGFVSSMSTAIEKFIAGTKSYNIQDLDNNIRSLTKNITEQEVRLEAMANKYYIQYAKMESALSEMQAQTDSLTSMFAGMTAKR